MDNYIFALKELSNSTYILPMVFLMSLFLGSFYNVVALRAQSGENMAFPPSHCTSCNHRLGFMDLFPVISWAFLGGKCRYCKEPISKIYPYVEIMTALSYTVVIWKYGITLQALPHLILMTVLVMATVCDLKTMEVPDRFVVVGSILVLILRVIIGPDFTTISQYMISGVVCFTGLFVILVVSKGGMGGADVKLYGLIGLTIGIVNGYGSLFYASLVATLYYLPQLLNKKAHGKTELPLVPFITIGVLLTYIVNIFEIAWAIRG